MVWADRRLLQQVLFNLLSNANKFTPVEGTVVLSVKRQDNEYWVNVADDGVGIEAADLSRIFDEFVQVGDRTDGSGLGLNLTKRLMAVMHGRIWV